MIKRILAILFASVLLASASDRVTLYILVTNATQTGDELTIDAVTRIWSNSHSATLIATNASTTNYQSAAATNLAWNLSAYALANNPIVYQDQTNRVRLTYPIGIYPVASEVGLWASFTYVTNVYTSAYTVRVPITVEANTNRTNIASRLVDAAVYATNRFEPAWEAFTNFGGLAGPNLWTGTNRFKNGWWTNLTLVNLASASGILGALTNGVLTNTILVSPIMSNAIAYSGFSSRGAGLNSEVIGNGATAAGNYSVSIGSGASSPGLYGIGVGYGVSAAGEADIAIGSGSEASYGGGVAIGTGTAVNATNAIALGNGANVLQYHASSIALGTGVATTETNQVMVGASTHKVRIPGRLEPMGGITNAVFTGTNVSLGKTGGPYTFLAMRRYNNATLANGDNPGVNPGGSSYLKVSGPNAAFAITGITNWVDGYYLVIENNSGYFMTLKNESGGDVPANRIKTMTGGDLTLAETGGAILIYDSQISRWVVVGVNATYQAFGSLYTYENDGSQDLGILGAWEVLTNFNTAGNSSLVTVDPVAANLTVVDAGTYFVTVTMSYAGTLNKTFHASIFTNAVECDNVTCSFTPVSATDMITATAAGVINLPANTIVDFRATPETAGDDITIRHGNIIIHKIK